MIRFRLLEPWRSRLLWLSLGGNLFAVALFAAPYLSPRRPPMGPGFDRLVERMAHNMPPGDADAFRAAMARERPWYEMSRNQLDESRAEIGRRIGQQPFDPAATHAAMNAMQDQLRSSAARFDDSLVMALGVVSPDARASLSRDMARHRPPGAPPPRSAPPEPPAPGPAR